MAGALTENETSNPSGVAMVRMRSFVPAAASTRHSSSGNTARADRSGCRAFRARESSCGSVITSCCTLALVSLNVEARPNESSKSRRMWDPLGETWHVVSAAMTISFKMCVPDAWLAHDGEDGMPGSSAVLSGV
jgi:hypothetical protein